MARSKCIDRKIEAIPVREGLLGMEVEEGQGFQGNQEILSLNLIEVFHQRGKTCPREKLKGSYPLELMEFSKQFGYRTWRRIQKLLRWLARPRFKLAYELCVKIQLIVKKNYVLQLIIFIVVNKLNPRNIIVTYCVYN